MRLEDRFVTAAGTVAALAGGYVALRAWPEVTHVVLQAVRLGALYVVARG